VGAHEAAQGDQRQDAEALWTAGLRLRLPEALRAPIVAIIVIVWAIIHLFYRWLLSSKNIQIEMLRARLADYRNVLEGASPSEAAYKIAQLKAQWEAIKGA
jgi:hypothetical protein